MKQPAIETENLSKAYPSKDGSFLKVLADISVKVPDGTVLAILGASGCGKSTLLRIIAGLDRDYEGQVWVHGKPVDGPGLDRGFVFQDHRLLPWMTVTQNIELGLHRLQTEHRVAKVATKLELVGLSAFAHAYPGQLSGGMAQRVAIARALAHDPELLLLDEPFGALDALTRMRMQEEIVRIQRHEKLACVLVTHDIEEAIVLADNILILSSRPGRQQAMLQVDLPKPRNRASPAFGSLRRDIYERFFFNPMDKSQYHVL